MKAKHPDNLCESCKHKGAKCPIESSTTGHPRRAVLGCYVYEPAGKGSKPTDKREIK